MENEKEKKILLIKLGVISLTVFIFIIWSFNLKNVWQDNKNGTVDNQAEFERLKTDFGNSLNSIQQQLDTVKSENQTVRDKGGALLGDVLTGAQKNSALIATSTADTIVSSTAISTEAPVLATSTLKNADTNCPKYINCMPTIGTTHPCQVPVGCENKTIIAY